MHTVNNFFYEFIVVTFFKSYFSPFSSKIYTRKWRKIKELHIADGKSIENDQGLRIFEILFVEKFISFFIDTFLTLLFVFFYFN